MDGMQPGQVIIPHGNGGDEPTTPSPVPTPPSPSSPGAPVPEQRPAPEPGEAPGPGETPEPVPSPTPGPEPITPAGPAPQAGTFTYNTGTEQAQPNYMPSSFMANNYAPELPEEISWTASEYIEHQKNSSWYGMLAIGGVVAAGLGYLITREWLTAGVIVFAAILFGAYAGHKPRTQEYALTPHGVQVGSHMYSFDEFRNFSIAPEGAIAGIVLVPLKRFVLPLTIYVAPDMEDQVMDFLSEVLPFEQHRTDAVDSLMRKVRF